MKQVRHESRLSSWSRRKLQTAEETQIEDLAQEVERHIPPEEDLVKNQLEDGFIEEQQSNEAPRPVLSDADMEPVEALTENSDFTKFMSPGVSDELRNLALRKMFQAPVFNIRDGLDEYDEDFTTFEKLGNIVTADMRHQMEMEANRKLEEEVSGKAETETVSDEQDLDSNLEQTAPIAAENDGSEESENKITADDIAEEDTQILERTAEKIERGQ